MVTEAEVKAPPYLALKTFFGALDALREGVPKRIDRGIWRSQSGAVQGQIMLTLRFFGLVDESDAPKLPLLEQLAQADESGRKKLFKPLVEQSYRQIIDHDLTKMTPSMLNEEMAKFGVSGDTLRKAVTFFLQAAKYLELPLSPFLADKTRSSPRPRRKSAVKTSGGAPTPLTPPSQPEGGSTKVIELHGGGTLTLIVSADVWAMPSDDRTFVLELIDKVQQYEKPSGKSKEKSPAKGE